MLPHSNPTNCSFSPPPSSPSRPVSTVKQEEGSNRSTKPIYGLFPDFGAWQSGDQQVYYDHPSTGATPSQSPSYIEPVNTKKRRRSESEPEHVVNKRFRCEFCGFAFDRKCNLTCHLKVHDVGRREVHCPRPGCDKKYGRRADANRHVRTVRSANHSCTSLLTMITVSQQGSTHMQSLRQKFRQNRHPDKVQTPYIFQLETGH